ncbi:T9SS type A sorting domain-containing protein [candidate division KSB1 bacterium]|nr:T9SS type A sorting domain-containing protein [candidate division KSB1 bacterium]
MRKSRLQPIFLILLISLLTVLTDPIHAQLPAFPGASGFGAFAAGGRGGDVYHVTSLEDDGPGSFRFGIETADSPRTIVFDMSGNIGLTSYLYIRSSSMTIAGQTAPDPGICIQNYGITVLADNVILRHLRLRPGDMYLAPRSEGGFTEDALTLSGDTIIADHISASWGVDENLSCGTSFRNITIQYCIIAEGLHRTLYYHGEYAPDCEGHSMGSLIKCRGIDAEASLHHNLWAHNNNRNPAIGSYEGMEYVQIDVRNNVMYNCGTFGYSSGASKQVDLNYVGNYIIAGRSTSPKNRRRAFDANAPNNLHIYQADNLIDPDLDTLRDGINTGWGMFDDTWTSHQQPFPMPTIETQSADRSYNSVLATAGAYPWCRDSVDARIIRDLRHGTGKIIDSQEEVGGFPALAVVTRPDDWDTDQDGMPDAWEQAHGFDKSDPGDRNEDSNQNGYTNLEEYLNSIALPSNVQDSLSPDSFGLKLHVYPNPFHPATHISYSLSGRAHVKLMLYNCLGQRIRVLTDGLQPAGHHSTKAELSSLPNGVYFILLSAGNRSMTKKIALLW